MSVPVQLDIEGPAFDRPVEPVWPFEGLPRQHFGCISADPPWSYKTYSDKGQTRSASTHYSVMSLDDIKALPVADLAAKDCVLLMWAIKPMLPHALDVMNAWGFRYSTIGFSWAKTTRSTSWSWAPKWHMGMGHWSRGNVEICLLGTRGKPKRIEKGVRELIVASVREHSRKPDEYLPAVERLCSGPYIELFSRTSRKNWSAWGNQTGLFDVNDELEIA